jgi:hypothetical protein
LACVFEEDGEGFMSLVEEAMVSTSNLVINGTMKKEMLLHLCLLLNGRAHKPYFLKGYDDQLAHKVDVNQP